jgi:hypothetical protein
MLVGIMDVSPLFEDEALFGKCLESVSASRRERAEHYKDYRDKCRCVGAGVLLNVMLGKYLCVGNLREGDFCSVSEAYVDDKAGEERQCRRAMCGSEADVDDKTGVECQFRRAVCGSETNIDDKAGAERQLLGEICKSETDAEQKLAISNDINLMTPDYELPDKNALIDLKINKAVTLVNPALNWNVTYSEKGKPEFLQDEILKFTKNLNCKSKSDFELQNIHFNISHSANYVACAIADLPVGIDIEGRRKVNSSVAKRYFTEEEIKSILCDEDFFKIWAFKEALGKYTGEGLMPVIGKSEKEVRDEVSVNHYAYGDFQICVVTRKC